MAQVLDEQIQQYLPLLGNDEKKSLLSVIKSFISLRNEQHSHISLEQYNKELDEAEVEYEKGEHISHDEMKNMVKKW